MELRLWTQGGSVLQAESGVAMRVADGKTMIREGAGPWKEAGDVTGAIAPEGDFMSYLQAVRDIQGHEPETRNGVDFARYTFNIDGPIFAGYIRDQTEASMRQQGVLQPGEHVSLPAHYAEM